MKKYKVKTIFISVPVYAVVDGLTEEILIMKALGCKEIYDTRNAAEARATQLLLNDMMDEHLVARDE